MVTKSIYKFALIETNSSCSKHEIKNNIHPLKSKEIYQFNFTNHTTTIKLIKFYQNKQ